LDGEKHRINGARTHYGELSCSGYAETSFWILHKPHISTQDNLDSRNIG